MTFSDFIRIRVKRSTKTAGQKNLLHNQQLRYFNGDRAHSFYAVCIISKSADVCHQQTF